MATTNFNTTYTGSANGASAAASVAVSIPANAFNISLTVSGGRGGNGCQDGGPPQGNGRPGGYGRTGTFTLPNFTARTLTIRPGGSGQQRTAQCGSCNCTGGQVDGTGSGGNSGTTGGGGSSGSGGGGGAASSVYDSLSGATIIVAGGGGGGGGGSMGCDAGSGGTDAGGFSAQTSGSVNIENGAGGGNAVAGDGGSGGAGGGGTFGGGGGSGGADFCGPFEQQNPIFDDEGNLIGYGEPTYYEVFSQGGGGGGSGYRSNVATLTSQSTNSGTGFVTLQYTAVTPEINSFTANPNPQNSTSGTPQYSTLLSWSVTDANSLTITSSTGETYNVTGTSSLNITNLPQTTVGSLSPASRTYTLTACFNSFCVTSQPLTVQVRNDNTPSNSWTASFSNLEPSTEYQFSLGQLQGVDMPTIGSVNGDGNFLGDGVGGSFSNPKTFTSGNNVVLKFTSLPFNTSLSGVSSTSIYGNTNTKTMSVTIGSQTFNVTAITRAPLIAETFDLANNVGLPPFPEKDFIPGLPSEYATSAIMTVDNIEIDMEIKASDGNLQVNINGTGWTNVRSI
jgi:hypothetical protein